MIKNLGIQDLKALALPIGLDAGELEKYMTADNVTYENVLTDIATALEMANSALRTDPLWAGLYTVTTEPTVEYPTGLELGTRIAGEYTAGDPRHGMTVAHHIPIAEFDYNLGWTSKFLKNARVSRIDASIMRMKDSFISDWQKRIFTRFFTSAENAYGGTGYDLPFVNASSNVPYAPPYFDGQTFATTHTHFGRYADSSAGREAAVAAGVAHLREHGINPPYTLIIPFADIDAWSALDGTNAGVEFVSREHDSLRYGNDESLVTGLEDERFVGGLKTRLGTVFLWASYRVPTDYMGLYRSYGANNPRNPIAMRVNEMTAGDMYILRTGAFRQFPLEDVVGYHEYGFSSNNRENGFCAYFTAAGDYVDPTIS